MDEPGPFLDSFFQAHAQAWHSYNDTWRSKQQGEVGPSGSDPDPEEPYPASPYPDILPLRPSGDLTEL